MKYLFKFIKPYTKHVVALMILYVLQSLCALFMPYVMSDIVEVGIRNQDMSYILKRGAIMVALAVGALVCALVTNAVTAKFSSQMSVGIRQQIFNKVNSLSFDQFSQLGTGSLITRTTDDVGWIEETISMAPFVLINAPTMLIGGIALSFKGDWLLPLISLQFPPLRLPWARSSQHEWASIGSAVTNLPTCKTVLCASVCPAYVLCVLSTEKATNTVA